MLPSSAQWFAQPRLIIGLMSGTSLDGIDAALIEVCGAIPPQHWRLCQFYTHPYSAQERTRIELVINAKAPLTEVMTTNVWLGGAIRGCRVATHNTSWIETDRYRRHCVTWSNYLAHSLTSRISRSNDADW